MKEGWIKLTKEGVYDSLTEKERENQDYLDRKYRIDMNIIKLLNTHEKNRQERYEKNGYNSDYSVNTETDNEDIISEEEVLILAITQMVIFRQTQATEALTEMDKCLIQLILKKLSINFNN